MNSTGDSTLLGNAHQFWMANFGWLEMKQYLGVPLNMAQKLRHNSKGFHNIDIIFKYIEHIKNYIQIYWHGWHFFCLSVEFWPDYFNNIDGSSIWSKRCSSGIRSCIRRQYDNWDYSSSHINRWTTRGRYWWIKLRGGVTRTNSRN